MSPTLQAIEQNRSTSTIYSLVRTIMQTLCIIQARMGSSRLAGKVMMPLAGKEVIWHVYNRVLHCDQIDKIVVATSDRTQDDALAEYCQSQNWLVFRGSETDVLSRFVGAAKLYPATNVVRITSDCPLVDPGILSKLINLFESTTCDYASTNYPERTFPVGTDCEIMKYDAMLKINELVSSPYDREHVTPYLYNKSNGYDICGLRNNTDQSHVRITLDTAEDYALISTIYDRLYRAGSIIKLAEAVEIFESI